MRSYTRILTLTHASIHRHLMLHLHWLNWIMYALYSYIPEVPCGFKDTWEYESCSRCLKAHHCKKLNRSSLCDQPSIFKNSRTKSAAHAQYQLISFSVIRDIGVLNRNPMHLCARGKFCVVVSSDPFHSQINCHSNVVVIKIKDTCIWYFFFHFIIGSTFSGS